MPSAEEVQAELAKVQSMDDFFGKDGVFAKLFASTLEQMLEGELTEHLGYEPYEAAGRNSGNNRNGRYTKKVRTSAGETNVQVPRDRNGEFEPQILARYAGNTNELEEKILAMYAQGLSTRDIAGTLAELYGVDISAATISTITEKVWPLVEACELAANSNRPLARIYPIVYLDAVYIKLRREGRVVNTAVYNVLGVDLEGQRDILGHWLGDGAEGANFWLSVLTDLQNRGVADIFLACVDGLNGFSEAIRAVFPRTQVQRCVIHQIRSSLRYVSWKDHKAFVADLKRVYQAATRDEAETNLAQLDQRWGMKYPMAVRSWQTNWPEVSTFFDYPAEIRRIIYTTNSVESYHRQLRKVTKTKAAFPTPEAARKLLYLATQRITREWTAPIRDWAKILNQLAIRFEGRLVL
ncbi:MAG: IS256 family transposase [Anaerolineae bacterium]|nr:IS256 family transposase [Anaerolineae bacterium]